MDASRACTITSHAPAWIDPELDDVVPGLQTESPLVRGIKPLGGVRLLSKALAEHANLEVPPDILHAYGEGGARRTHNDCVFDLYTPEMRAARRTTSSPASRTRTAADATSATTAASRSTA